ncbi:MAG: DUF1987 domain-containing protein [Bacteroidales bacterium]|nr:DUF1987 domain-containing protein [Bacteroidales bacterium]
MLAEKVFIQETSNSPGFEIDAATGKIEIFGKSTLANPIQFYKDLIARFLKYLEAPCRETSINIKLQYVNTSSSKWLFYFLKNVEGKHKSSSIFTINWFYEEDDESIFEAGDIYKSLLQMPFNLHQY